MHVEKPKEHQASEERKEEKKNKLKTGISKKKAKYGQEHIE